MNILMKLANRSGKMALSALQAVGLTAVVGVAGVAAYQFLGTSSDDNTAFNPAGQYNPGEVVYVSGANTGSYVGNAYGGKLERGTGEPGSSMRVSTKTLKLLENQELAERAAQEMAENEAEMNMSAMGQNSAYQFGQTEGLGMGSNAVNEQELSNNPMGAMSKQMSGIKDMMANVQQKAQAAAAGKDGKGGAAEKDGKGTPTLASATPGWRSGSSSGGGTNGGSSSFVVQNSGKNGQAGADISTAMGALANAQNVMNNMREGSQVKAKASFGKDAGLGKSKDASVMGRFSGKDGETDLKFFAKRSADFAKNKNRHNTEGNVFLADAQTTPGLLMTVEGVTLGSGAVSNPSDLSSVNPNLGQQITDAIQEVKTDEIDPYEQDTSNLLAGWLLATAGIFLLIKAMFWLAKAAKAWTGVPWVAVALWVAFGIACAAALTLAIGLIVNAANYADKWGGGWMSTMAGLTGCVAVAAIGLSLFWNVSDKFQNFCRGLMQKFLGIKTDVLAIDPEADFGVPSNLA